MVAIDVKKTVLNFTMGARPESGILILISLSWGIMALFRDARVHTVMRLQWKALHPFSVSY